MINIEYLKTFYFIGAIFVGILTLIALPTIISNFKQDHKKKIPHKK